MKTSNRRSALGSVRAWTLGLALAGAAVGGWCAEPVGMVTGSPTGTYYQFGRDIAEVAAKDGLRIEVKPSAGSLANIERMNSKENAAFGIVQSDVLGYLKRDSTLNRELAQRLRVIFPFYLEEVHVLAKGDIRSLRDLNGKRVAIGMEGSGTWLTAKNLFKLLRIAPSEELLLGTEDAELKLIGGDLDAMLYVAGKPVKAFEPLGRMAAAANDPVARNAVAGLHFVPASPVDDAQVFAEYDESSIGPADYPWLKSEVPVAAVRAVLVGFDFSTCQSAYCKKRCSELKTLGNAIRDNLETLQSGAHHPKWQQVSLDAGMQVRGWQIDVCSRPQETAPSRQPSDSGSSGSRLQDRLRDQYFSPGTGGR